MRPIALSILSLLWCAVVASAQTARLQIIHNAPDPVVDIYVNGFLFEDDFAFRTATPFQDVPAGIPLNVGIAPGSSSSVTDTIANFEVTFEDGKTYAVTASGIVGDPNTPFTLIVDDAAQEFSSNPNLVAFNVLHGSPDAPAVDVAARTVGTLLSNVSYGQFSGYLEVAPGQYYIDVKAAGTQTIVGTYFADLSGLGGGAARVFASGLLNGTPGFGLFAALPTGQVIELPLTPVARVQVIHNSPDPTVDIYANDALFEDDFAFRTATEFRYVPAGVDITLGIALDNSSSVNDTLVGFPVNLENGKTYVVIASGIVGDPNTPFTLAVNDMGREVAADTNQVDIMAYHGSTNAPNVDIAAIFVGTVITDLAYGSFTGYLGLEPDVYDLAVRPAGSSNTVASYRADLSGLKGAAAVVFASGLLNDDPAFGLFAALPNGTVVELPATPLAKVQVVHNSPEPTVDVYAGNDLLIDNFAFRTATPYVEVPSDVEFTIGVAPENSSSAADAIATFDVTLNEGIAYTVFASGIVGDPTTPFTLIAAEARETADQPALIDVSIHHGSPDAPEVDVAAVFENLTVTGLAYGQTTDYLSLPATLYDFAIRASGSDDVLAVYRADLTGLEGNAIRVFASGLLGGNPDFGLYAVLADGTVVGIPTAPTARVQVIHNSPDPTVDIYAGQDVLADDFAFRTATPFVTIPADRQFTIAVAPENSQSASDAIANFDVTLEDGRTYAVTASGIVGDMMTPFTLIIDDMAQEAAVDPAKVEFNVLHGSTNAPAVDVAVVGLGDIFTNLSYGEFTAYIPVDAAAYQVEVKPAGQPDPVATYDVNLTGLDGGAARVFASGLLGGSPAFGLFAALPDGTVVEFPEVVTPMPMARLQIIHNSPDPTVDIYVNSDLYEDDFAFRTATEFRDVPANVMLDIGIAPGNSSSVNDVIANFPVMFEEGKTYVVVASGIVGDPTTPFTLIATDAGQETGTDQNLVDIAVLHGSTDAPPVDIDAVFVGNLLQNLAYGDLTGYLNIDPTVYDLAIRPAGLPDVVVTFRADLNGLGGAAAVVFASGFLAGTPGFGLFAALPDGTVIQLPVTPTARVQVIHNSATPTVDVYAGEQLIIDDFEYRTATPFVELPSDRDFDINIAPSNSTSAADAIATFPVNLPTGASLSVMAAGLVGDPNTPFNLYVDVAQEAAAPGQVAVSAFHGATDAPSVDVDERLAGNLISNLAFGEYTPYLTLPAEDFLLDVKAAGNTDIVASFDAPLSLLDGQAVRVMASGFLGGTPEFGLFAVLANGAVIELPSVQRARVQVIHNSPSPTVDIYINGDLAIEDFEFREATGYGYLDAGVTLNLGIAPAGSASVNDTIANFPVVLDNGGSYVVIANGIVGNPTTPFRLDIIDGGREVALDDTQLELGIFHGSPNAPAVDVVPFGDDTPLLSNLAYGDFTGYLSLEPDVIVLDVETSPSPNGTLVGTWGGDFSPLAGLVGVVFASGLVGDDPAFDLYLALPDGFVLQLPSFSRLQVIHNSPSPTVDLYLDDDRALDNFAFRQATNFGLFRSGTPFTIGIAPENSQSVNDAIYTLNVPGLETGKTYIAVAAGVVGNMNTPFEVYINENGRYRANGGSGVDLALYHGSPDAPEVDVIVPAGPVLFDNVEFGEFSDYINVPASSYIVSITPANDNTTIVASYTADVSGIEGQAATIFASGFLTGGTPAFEPWVALSNGLTFPLTPFVSTNELDTKLTGLQVSPNPAIDEVFVRFALNENEALRYRITDIAGRLVMEGDFGQVNAGPFAQQIRLGALNNGMYHLELVSDNGVKTTRFVVQR